MSENKSLHRARPFSERQDLGSFYVDGLRVRDVTDCFIRCMCLARVDEQVNKDLYEQACLGQRRTLYEHSNAINDWNWDGQERI